MANLTQGDGIYVPDLVGTARRAHPGVYSQDAVAPAGGSPLPLTVLKVIGAGSSRILISTMIDDEAGNRLGGSGTQLRIYDNTGLTVLSTLYVDATSGATQPNPISPNAGKQTTLTRDAAASDATLAVADVTGFQVGDLIPIYDGTNTVYAVIVDINAGANQIGLGAPIGTAFSMSNALIGNADMVGHVWFYIDNSANRYGQTKDTGSSRVLPAQTVLVPLAASGGTPAVVLGTAAAPGTATTFVRVDDTLLAFDATIPGAETIGGSGAVGSVALAARRDHSHPISGTASVTIIPNTGTLDLGSVANPWRSLYTSAAIFPGGNVQFGGANAVDWYMKNTNASGAMQFQSADPRWYWKDGAANNVMTLTSSALLVGDLLGGSIVKFPITVQGDDDVAAASVGIAFKVGAEARPGKGAIVYRSSAAGWNRGDMYFLQSTTADTVAPALADVAMVIFNSRGVAIGSTTDPGAKNLFLGGKMFGYNAVATAGWGVPGINGYGRSVAQTAAVASIAAYTVGAADGSFIVSGNVLVTASTTHTFSIECAYTDEGNTARVVTFNVQQLGGTLITSITNVTGLGPYEGVPLHIRAKAATTITIRTNAGGTYTSVTYNAEGAIQQVA